MNANIRRLGVVLVALFVALAFQLNYLQVIRSDQLANAPGNTRSAVRDFGEARGPITTRDGVVLAESYRNPNRDSPYAYLRRYPEAELYGHITGFFSYTFGSTGIERAYNAELAGRKVAPTVKGIKDLLISKTVTGNVELTIDSRIQKAAASALGARKGSVVVIDIRSGALLGMVSFPRYDPNPLASSDVKRAQAEWKRLNDDPDRPLLARAYRERYAPGSTFKTVTAASALENKIIGLDTPIYPTLSALPMRFTTRPLRNFGGGSCGGNAVSVFVVSCNTAFAQMALDTGGEKLNATARAFGFNRLVPLDVSPGAVQSFYPEPAFFNRNDPQLAQSGIGQGQVSATTLQMAMVAAAVANKGTIKRPHLLREIRSSEGEEVQAEPSATFSTATSQEVAAELASMMEQVVVRGTGKRAALPGVGVAAKTGTAQTGRGTAHAWTIAFAPLDQPRIAVAVLIENQQEVSTLTGGKIAAPAARKILETALAVTE